MNVREPLGNYSNIKSFSGLDLYAFNTKASIPYLKTIRAQNIPDVSFDEVSQINKQISDRLAMDTLTNQIKESYENIGYTPKLSVGKIVSLHSNGVMKSGFEKLSPLELKSKQINTQSAVKQSQINTFFSPKVKSEIVNTPVKKEKFKLFIPIKEKSEIVSSPQKSDYGSDIFNAIQNDKPRKRSNSSEIVNSPQKSDYGSDIFNAIQNEKQRKRSNSSSPQKSDYGSDIFNAILKKK